MRVEPFSVREWLDRSASDRPRSSTPVPHPNRDDDAATRELYSLLTQEALTTMLSGLEIASRPGATNADAAKKRLALVREELDRRAGS